MVDYSKLYKDFVSKPKSLLIAPAGYGKTYTIAECLRYTEGTQLVLTHTHAGVASLKEKIKKSGITSNKYNIETIDSFAQKYVDAFYCRDDIPEQENSKKYFPFIIEKAATLVEIKPIKDIIKLTYKGLFVDEYQDCTKTQHRFIIALADILPVHLLGDPLQGIFYFSEKLIDWETDLKDFANARFKLTEPWRWKNTSPKLGTGLTEIRMELENKKDIDLNQYESGIEISLIAENDIYSGDRKYNERIINLLDSERSLLLIYPESQNLNARKKLVKTFQNRFYLVEAMDGKDFYNFSKIFDNSDSASIYKKIHEIIYSIFNKSELDKWFNDDDLKNKRQKKIE
jgi:DNA helicase-2/ATP-dependent DNA helicase PcrA